MKPEYDSRPRIPAAIPNIEEVRERMSVIVWWRVSKGGPETKMKKREYRQTFVLWMTFSGTTGFIWRSFSSAFMMLCF